MSLPGCFSKVLRNGFLVKSNFGHYKTPLARHSSIWEPDYLILAKTKTPEYDLIDIQMKGYDFSVLEKYQKFIYKIAKMMNVNIKKSWPAPQQDFVIHHYKVNSTDIEYQYNMQICERNVQVVDVKSHIMPLFIEAVVTTCPPGVKLTFQEHQNEVDEALYVPNFEIRELQEELESIGTVKKKKRPQKKK